LTALVPYDGDPNSSALTKEIKRVKTHAMKRARWKGLDWHEAEDFGQIASFEFFLRIKRGTLMLGDRTSADAFVNQVVANRCASHFEHAEVVDRHLPRIQRFVDWIRTRVYGGAEEMQEVRDLEVTLKQAITVLSAKHWKVFELKRYTLMTNAAIGAEVGLSASSVKTYLVEAANAIRRIQKANNETALAKHSSGKKKGRKKLARSEPQSLALPPGPPITHDPRGDTKS
jgi:DNA-directed RNA polymerase specialized sigma24 family protein